MYFKFLMEGISIKMASMRSIPQFFWYFTKELIHLNKNVSLKDKERAPRFVRDALSLFTSAYLIIFSVMEMYLILSL